MAAIENEEQYENAIEEIDRLMASGKLTRGQESYMETLVQLVEAYERKHHAIDVSDISGLDTLRFLLVENGMNASDLARLLGVHASLGSKILNGDRGLTLKHIRKLADHFKLEPSAFIDEQSTENAVS